MYGKKSLKRNWVTHDVTTSPNLPTYNYKTAWETAETIDLWVADRQSVG
jgi:hypothetical protein